MRKILPASLKRLTSKNGSVLSFFTCAKCYLSCIGCTKRYWEKRLEEHTHLSALTGESLQGVQIFAPMQHIRAGCHVHVRRENFQIIGSEKDVYLLRLKESILISTTRPQLNGSVTSVPLHLFTS